MSFTNFRETVAAPAVRQFPASLFIRFAFPQSQPDSAAVSRGRGQPIQALIFPTDEI
jgi:hypothetical protein